MGSVKLPAACLAVAVVLLLPWSLSAQPQDWSDTSARAGPPVVRVGIYDNAPLVFVGPDGKASGIYPDILRHIADREGWRLEWVPGGWEECLDRLRKGEIDLLTSIAYTDARAKEFDFNSYTIRRNWGCVYAHAEDVQSFPDLDGKVVGILKDDVYAGQFAAKTAEYGITCRLMEFQSYGAVFKAVQEGDVDAGVVNHIYGMTHQAVYQVHHTSITFFPQKLRLAAPKGKNAWLLDAIDRRLALMEEGRPSPLREILDRWLGGAAPVSWPVWVDYALVGAGLGVLLLAGAVLVLRRQVRARTADIASKNAALEREIAARARAETALRKEHDLLNRIMATVPVGVIVLDSDRRVTFANPRCAEVLGVAEPELVGADALAVVSRVMDMSGRLLLPEEHALARVLRSGSHEAGERRMLELSDRTRKYVAIEGSPLFDDEGRVAGVVGTIEDISEQVEAEQALRRERDFAESLVQTAPIIVLVLDVEGRIVRYNRYFEEISGRPLKESLGRSWFDLFLPERDRGRVREVFLQSVRDITIHGHTNPVVTRDGQERLIEWHARTMKGAGGEALGVLSVGLDITERSRTEQELERSRRRLSVLMSNLPGMAYRCANDRDWTMDYVSEGCLDLTGYPAEDVVNSVKVSYNDLIHPDDRRRVWDEVQQAVAEDRSFKMIYRITRSDGKTRWVWEQGRRVEGTATDEATLEGFITDITDRVEAEHALRESEERYRSFLKDFHGIAFRGRMDFTPIFMHGALEQITGYNEAEFLSGKIRWDEIMVPEDLARLEDEIQRSHDIPDYSSEREYRILHRNGTIRWVADLVHTVVGEGGKAVAVQGAIYDITSRKDAEQALRDSEERFRAVFEGASIGMALADETGYFVTTNAAFQQMLGHTPEEFRKLTVSDITHPDDRDRGQALVDDLMTGKRPTYRIEKRYLHKSGRVVWVRVTVNSIRDESGQIVYGLGMVEDVTEQKHAEQQLHSEMEFNRTLVQATPAFYVAISHEGRTLMMNEAMLGALGYTEDEVVGTNYLDTFVPEDERNTLAAVFGRLMSSREGTISENHVLTRDGRLLLVEWRGRTIRKADGSVDYFFGLGLDITERRKAEEERASLEAQLIQSQKLEAIGTLAGGIAHDFNNLLTGIIGYANLLRAEAPEGSEVAESATAIEGAAEKAALLTSQLLGFARRGKFQNVPVDLNQIVTDVVNLVKRTFEKDIEVKVALNARNACGLGDPGQMQQIVLNLAVNARDAMSEGGTLGVATDVMDLDEHYCRLHGTARPGRYIRITVSDTGEGMTPEVRQRIFEPFFTTKPAGKGTGMGLAMVYGIVRNHNGSIEVYSEPGHGSVFRVYLPVCPDTIEAETVEKPLPVKGSGRVLVVDDEEIVRQTASRLLADLGYDVLAAPNGREAVDIYRSLGSQVDLVIIDMIMPEMNGRECFRALKEIDPNVRALLSTGYGLNGAAQELLDEGMSGFVQKPYGLLQLSEAVASALRDRDA